MRSLTAISPTAIAKAARRRAADETSGAAGSLTALFSVGADEPLEITLSNNISGLPTLFSKGDAITYSVSGNVLTATADAGGPDQRVVFTLTVNPDGSWSFDLKDQLDHVDNGLNDENYELRTSADGSTSVGEIDFSSIILGTDADGDSVAAAPGTFTVDVQDDVPAGDLSGTVTVHVDEDNLSEAAGDGDLSTGIVDADADTDEATFSSAALSAVIDGRRGRAGRPGSRRRGLRQREDDRRRRREVARRHRQVGGGRRDSMSSALRTPTTTASGTTANAKCSA